MKARFKLLLLIFWGLMAASLLDITACQLEDPKIDLSVDSLLHVVSKTNSLPADGQNTFDITATLLSQSDPNQTLKFTSTYGKFVNGTATTGTPSSTTIKCSGRTATARLQVTTAVMDRIFVTVELQGYTREIELSATRAFPDSFLLSADNTILEANGGNTISVKVHAIKSKGNVSDMTPYFCSFANINMAGLSLGFINFGTLTGNDATIQVKSNNSTVGDCLFWVKLPKNDTGDSLTASIKITVM